MALASWTCQCNVARCHCAKNRGAPLDPGGWCGGGVASRNRILLCCCDHWPVPGKSLPPPSPPLSMASLLAAACWRYCSLVSYSVSFRVNIVWLDLTVLVPAFWTEEKWKWNCLYAQQRCMLHIDLAVKVLFKIKKWIRLYGIYDLWFMTLWSHQGDQWVNC